MKKLPYNVSPEKNYRDSERDALIRETEMARDAYDEMIRLAERCYNIPIRKKSAAK